MSLERKSLKLTKDLRGAQLVLRQGRQKWGKGVRGKKAQATAGSRPPQVQGRWCLQESRISPRPSPQGAYQTRKLVPARACFFPTPLLFFLLPSLPPFLPSTFIDHLCVRYCVDGGNMKMIKEFLTSSYQVVKLVINKFNKANNAIATQGSC